MQVISPARRSSRRLPASTCAEIEAAAPIIGDAEVVAWLQRHHAAATTRGPILRPYGRDAVAWFRDGLLESPAGEPALILADGRAFDAHGGVLDPEPSRRDFRAERRRLCPRFTRGDLAFACFLGLVVTAIAVRILVLG